ncbi:MAG: GTPase ObgE [Puniceicoccaceae bacterium MED-G30]|jgi:GTP-binding protein|nr:MAG: GTPase ObgE [Puniceicoccaceae bacterium MED-G30]RPG85597.1 MAG: GTPase ObgE [Coraliomargarita sp. TMED73]|tara:strand:+ start:720 stop:1748 length:1029 start_codon:yes stop_codon:yes gene_type:complete
MFYDEVKVTLQAGNGGDGCFSFRRAKYEPKGGPDGGNGGRGGDVYLIGDHNKADLTDYYFKPGWKAGNGEPGRGSNQHGAGGGDLELRLPVGTILYDRETDEMIAEVTEDGQRVCILEGGVGGKGNTTFKSSTNQAPREFTLGKPGDGGDFRLVIKTIADVGLIGFPNAGKSTLLNMITNAHPKTGAYPFTTMFPTVGVLEYPEKYERITLADIPGLIQGASENRGLGHRFLKHVERCKVLLVMIDMQGTDGREPLGDYRVLLSEIRLYKAKLAKKPILVAANKMDEPDAAEHLKTFAKKCPHPVYPISCVSDEGFVGLKEALLEAVLELRRKEQEVIEEDG